MRQMMTLALVGGLTFVLAGCKSPGQNSMPSTKTTDMKMSKMKGDANAHHRQMVDNAMLHDMCLVDGHFVPHTAELNGTGAARLDRMAILLSTYGGTVHYDTEGMDSDLTPQRIAHIREYLEVTGCDMTHVDVVPGLSRGRTQRATKAIMIDDRGTSSEKQSGSTSTTLLSPSGS